MKLSTSPPHLPLKPSYLAVLISLLSYQAYAEEAAPEHDHSAHQLETLTISADMIDSPVKTEYDIKPLLGSANDGADVLKQIPGISLIRQGGMGSDPVLRGLGGTRLNVLIDGVPFGGACNHRMDPPTAYVKPGSFKSFSVLQGPQSVRQGSAIAGAINFEREIEKFDEIAAKIFISGKYGSFDQSDISTDVSAGYEKAHFNYTGSRSQSGNYSDGNGDEIDLSFYETWNDRYAINITPDDDTLVQFSFLRSDGVIGNPTIHMDVTDLDRDNYGFRFKKDNLTPWFKNVDVKYSYTDVEHLMDNFSLRPLESFHEYVVMAQDWQQHFAKGEATFEVHPDIELTTGLEYRKDDYQASADGGFREFQPIPDLSAHPKNEILDFENYGGYMELAFQQKDNLRWVGGFRGDSLTTNTGTMHAGGETTDLVLSGSNQSRTQYLWSGFARGEYDFENLPLSLMAGYGHSERAADYWEVYSMDAFALNAEKNDEIDIKLTYGTENFTAELSGFYSYISDFILVYRGNSASNIDAQRVGTEAKATYYIDDIWSISANLAYTHADNITQDTALAQTPPLEGTLGFAYNDGTFSAGFDTRFVNSQDRIHAQYGNTLALDSTPSAGFIVSSLKLGYNYEDTVNVNFGIDNLFDKAYSEHLNRSGSFGGISSTTKINEPGRIFWARVSVNFDVGESMFKKDE